MSNFSNISVKNEYPSGDNSTDESALTSNLECILERTSVSEPLTLDKGILPSISDLERNRIFSRQSKWFQVCPFG